MHFSYMAHKNENSTQVPYALPTRLCRKYAGEFPPISPTLAQENRGSRDQWATLTRLSIHGEGHRNEEAKRHRGGAARQSKLRAARQGPTLYLEAWKKQGLRAAFLQGSHPGFLPDSFADPASLQPIYPKPPSIREPLPSVLT